MSSTIHSPVPRRFEFSIGGYFGPSFVILLVDGGCLEYRASEGGHLNRLVMVAPEPKLWTNFRRSMFRIGVDKWERRYLNESVCDGTSWRLELTWDELHIQAEGSNGYPEYSRGEGRRIPKTSPMDAFCNAVSRLIGGLEIH